VKQSACHGAEEQLGTHVVAGHHRLRPERVAAEAGDHVGQPVRRVRVARPVLGVAVEWKVGKDEPKAVRELLHDRLPLAVG
jgi:hypothetical protein